LVDRRSDEEMIKDDMAGLKTTFADTIKTLTEGVKQITQCAQEYQSNLKRGLDAESPNEQENL
jgi:hypothetical protein